MFRNTTIKSVKEHTGELVKILRMQAALTQEQLAEKLGMSRLTIQHLEAGKNPTMDTLLKVLQHFDMLSSFDNYIASEIHNNNQQSLY